MAARISLVLSESSVNTANNTSVVTAKLYYYGNGVSWNNGGCSGYVIIDGTQYSFSGATITTSTSAQLITTKQKTVTHGSDGKKTVSVSARLVTDTTDADTLTTSNSITLTTINRVSSLSLDKTTVPADGTTTVIATATKNNSSFTDIITVELGDYTQTVTSGTAFTIPMTWNNAIPSDTSATATVTVTTKSGSTVIGTKSVNLTVTVPSSVKPTISDINIIDTNTAVANAFSNIYLANLSRLKFDIAAVGAYGSTITDYSTTFNSKTYTDSSFTISNLSAKSYTVSTTVTDSRNRTATYQKTITVIDYSKPVITDITTRRCNPNGIVNTEGTAFKIIVSGEVSSVNNLNTKNLVLRYGKKGTTDYTEIAITPTNYAFTESHIITDIDFSARYEYIITLSDKLNSSTQIISSGLFPTISRLAGGGGLTLFDEATEKAFIVGNNMPSYFTGDFLVEDEILENAYNNALKILTNESGHILTDELDNILIM